MMKGGGGNSAVFIDRRRRDRRRHQDPRLGQAAARQDQDGDRQAGDAHHQHAHALRSRQRQRRVSRRRSKSSCTRTRRRTWSRRIPSTACRPARSPNIFKQNGGKGMPKRTFKDKMTIGKGADQIDLYYFGRAHTGGDAFVVFPALRVMHVGDTMPTRATCRSWTRTTAAAAWSSRRRSPRRRQVRGVDTIINGHNPTTTTPADLKTLLGVHRRLREVRAGREEGRQDGRRRGGTWKTPAKYTGYANAEPGAREGRRAGGLRRNEVNTGLEHRLR